MRVRAWVGASAVVAVVAGGLIWKLGMADTRTGGDIALGDVIPAPAQVRPADGVRFVLAADTAIVTSAGEAAGVGEYLAALWRTSTGFGLPVGVADSETPDGAVSLLLTEPPAGVGAEGYTLDIAASGVVLRAQTAAGLFWGVQTLRQLLPATVHSGAADGDTVHSDSSGATAWTIPGGQIVDQPRFGYRGMMLDVARHFFAVPEVKRVIDLAAMHKLNRLHLHLTDDQGWRLAIDGWPRLTEFGAGTEVGTGPGGFYTKEDYREIVRYAQSRFITVVPEVDLPGHTNAALASYPELNCDDKAPPRYTGIEVGFSALCVDREVTYRFLDDVFGELAELTPGEYLHIGGDEAKTLAADDYATVVNRAQEIVSAHGKTPLGWHEVAGAKVAPGTVLQYWGVSAEQAPEVVAAAAAGARIIMSPANHTYLDMKYDSGSPLGLSWAGLISVKEAYEWDPVTHLPGLDPKAVLGVESPLWTETVRTTKDIEFLAFPRLAATAEHGWSPADRHDWSGFRTRLAFLGEHWQALDVAFYRSDEIDWHNAT